MRENYSYHNYYIKTVIVYMYLPSLSTSVPEVGDNTNEKILSREVKLYKLKCFIYLHSLALPRSLLLELPLSCLSLCPSLSSPCINEIAFCAPVRCSGVMFKDYKKTA